MGMRKLYEIGGRRVTLKSSAHTWFLYKGEFGRELSEDLERAIAINALRAKEADEIKKARLFGEEYRLWMGLLWAFAAEGTPRLMPFEDWIKTIDGVDLAEIVKIVTELYFPTIKPDRKNRGLSDDEDESGGVCTEELVDDLLSVGVTIEDMRDMTIAQALNIFHAHIRRIKRARGEKDTDPEEQYRALKEAVELIESGEVTDYDPKELERVKEKLRRWENG